MLDRLKVESILRRRFLTATPAAVAAAANAIMGLEDGWEEVLHHEDEFGYHYSARCGEIGSLAREPEQDGEFRIFKRRISGTRSDDAVTGADRLVTG
jgi:hypothetical protein